MDWEEGDSIRTEGEEADGDVAAVDASETNSRDEAEEDEEDGT
jgi:hypothetical protein